MKTTLLAALLAASAFAHAAAAEGTAAAAPAASAASGVDPAVVAKHAAEVARLNEAARLIRGRQPQVAIDQILDPLIAAQEAENADRKETLYCANTTTEALLYMLQAAKDKKAAIALDGTLCNALFMRGFAEIDLGRLAAAEADYGRAVALSPSNPHYLSEMGELHSKKHEWAEALAWFHRAEGAKEFASPGQADAELGRALRGIGFVDVELGKLDEAEATYRRCLEIDAHDQKAQAELGYVLGVKARQAGAAK